MKAESILDCHVLVIGSGGAGTRAAIETAGYGSTILLSKTLTGKGGCTTMAEGGYNAVMNSQDCTEDHFTDTMRGGAFLNNPNLVRVLVDEAPERFKDLISWGAVFDTAETSECLVAQRPFGGQCFSRTCYAGDRTGHEMMATLVEKVRALDILQIQDRTAINLLLDGDRVCGIITLDREGNLGVIRADAVVLASGGGTQVFDISTNCAAATGDGHVMAWRAGAELIDMEMVQFHPTGAITPKDTRGRLITEAVRGEGGVLKNTSGERFMDRYDPVRKELSTRDVVARSIQTEILNGNGTENGGVHLDVSHLPDEVIEKRLPIMLEQFLIYGVDIRKEPMEVAPTAHHIMGGLAISSQGATTLPGLFACGEITGGVHGANRLGGNSLADTQVFGKRAGESAGKTQEIPVKNRLDPKDQVKKTQKRLAAYLAGDTSPSEYKQLIKDVMWEKCGVFRNGADLREALTLLTDLQQCRPHALTPANLAECCSAENMRRLAWMMVVSALTRPESRGAHVRTDISQDWTAESSPYGHTHILGEECRIEAVTNAEKRS